MASSSPLHSSKPLPVSSPLPPPPHSDHPSMFCTSKSSKWLQRLRSSRGFPESDHNDLDHFLSTFPQTIDPTDSALARKKTPLPHDNLEIDKCDNSGAVQGRDLINNVLSELFHMGDFEDKSRITRKKSCRKQRCPRICVVSTDSDVQDVADRKERLYPPSLLPLTLSSRHKVNQLIECVGEEEEKGHSDLSEYSQTEVTVIDTSVPCWKFEKMLYRSKNVWKVGDKKGKGLMIGERKNRKERVNENGGDVQKKILKKKMKLCNSSKYGNREEAMVLSKSDRVINNRIDNGLFLFRLVHLCQVAVEKGHGQGKMVAANEKKRHSCSQVQEKSFCKKHLDEASSVILIKSIPTTNKKNVPGISNSSVKSLQR